MSVSRVGQKPPNGGVTPLMQEVPPPFGGSARRRRSHPTRSRGRQAECHPSRGYRPNSRTVTIQRDCLFGARIRGDGRHQKQRDRELGGWNVDFGIRQERKSV